MKRTRRVQKRGVMCPQGLHDEWVHYKKPNGWRCAACHRAASKKNKQTLRAQRPAQALYDSAKQRATKKGIKFTITVADVEAAMPKDGMCPILGKPLKSNTGTGTKYAGDWSPTLDRINSEWGYEPGNIAVISHKANRAKNTLTADELHRVAVWMRRMGFR